MCGVPPPACSVSVPRDLFFFFNDTATTEIYTLSLHDALPISRACSAPRWPRATWHICSRCRVRWTCWRCARWRSEEHTSELQSHLNLVCRLLLEKKNTYRIKLYISR